MPPYLVSAPLQPRLLPHVHDTSDTISLLHCFKSGIDLWKRLSVGDELVDLELALHVIINQVRELGATLDTAKGTTLARKTCQHVFSSLERRPTFQTRPVTSWNAVTPLANETNSAMARLTASRDLLSCSCDSNDNTLTPSFVASL